MSNFMVGLTESPTRNREAYVVLYFFCFLLTWAVFPARYYLLFYSFDNLLKRISMFLFFF